jgi:hypothetical protein
MLGPPVAFQRFSDDLGVGFDVWIPQLGELCAVPLSSELRSIYLKLHS